MQASNPGVRSNTFAPDQTVFTTHEQLMQGSMQNAGLQTPGITRNATMPSPGTPQPNQITHQQAGKQSVVPATNHTQQGQSFQQALISANVGQPVEQKNQVQTKVDPKLIIYLVIALVVLIALIIFFLILIQHPHSTTMMNGISYQPTLL